MAPALLAVILFALGLILGPWLGMVVDRAVEREGLAVEHRCPRCHASLGGPAALVPVASWFRRCGEDPTHSTIRYPLVDVATAAGFALVGLRFGTSWELGPYLLLVAALVTMSAIDVETHLLLNILTYPTLVLSAFLIVFLHSAADDGARTGPALLGALLFGGLLGAAFLAYPPGLGFGDVKLAPTLGLFLGWLTADMLVAVRLVFYAIIVSFFLAGFGGLALRALTKQSTKAEIPMGPSLAFGTFVIILVSSPSVTGLLAA